MNVTTIESIFPVSPVQQYYLLNGSGDAAGSTHYGQSVYSLSGSLDIDCFETALRQLVERQPILRTSFAWKRIDRPVQVIHKDASLYLDHYDWSTYSTDEKNSHLEDLLERHAKSFDASRAALIRMALCRTDYGHMLVCSYHYLILDSRSSCLLIEELLSIYKVVVGEELVESAQRPTYKDYLAWLKGQDLSPAQEFWMKTFGEPVSSTPVTLGRTTEALPVPPEPFKGYSEQSVQLSTETTSALKAICENSRISINSVLQTAWAQILSRYSGDREIVLGATTSGRGAGLKGAESIIGPLMNTLPIKVSLSPDSEVMAVVKCAHSQLLELDKYAHISLPQIQEWIGADETRPLFESVVNIDGQSLRPPSHNGFIAQHQSKTPYPLLVKSSQTDLLSLMICYDSNRFDPATVHRVLSQLRTLIENFTATPHQSVSQWSMLNDEEQYKLLLEQNATYSDYDRQPSLHLWFEAQVAKAPDRMAIRLGAAELTYSELNRKANQLAHYLINCGVRPETLVGIYMERCIEAVVAILGIIKAGGAYVPLDPSSPLEHLSYIVDETQPLVVLTTESLADQLPYNCGHVICLDADWDKVARESQQSPTCLTEPESAAYVMYTSGSTGRPKGIRITHKGILRLVINQDYIQLGPSDIVAQVSNTAFDAATFEIWGSLLNGSQLQIISRDIVLSTAEFVEHVREHSVTVMFLTTALFNQIAREDGTAFSSLRYLLFGGEAVEPRWVKEVMQKGAPEHLLHVYGPTETTTFATWHLVEADKESWETIPIGKSIKNTRVYILDEYKRMVGEAVTGELYIGGEGVARDYLKRADQTAERFVPDPYSGESGSRMYRTGDVCRWVEGGKIEFLGRVDNQVKVRGYRIEKEEIESVLKQHSGVGEAVVEVRESGDGDKRLVGYVVGEEGLTPGELKAYLRDRIPEYMVPARLVMIDRLPLTPNGKLDRQALPEPDATRPDLYESYVAPRTEQEKALAGVWSKILGLDRIGINDNFFDMGGDSIRSIQMRAEALKVGLEFSIQELFKYQTIDELAQVARVVSPDFFTRRRTEPFSLIIDADRQRLPEGVEDAYPLLMLQEGMLFHSEYNRDISIYHDIISYRLQAAFDLNTLEAATRRVMSRHAVLRTSFDLTGYSEPLQLVHRTVPAPIEVKDLRHLPPDEQGAFISEWIASEKEKPFDWSKAPLFRLFVHCLNEETFQFTKSFHHAILDGWSEASLTTELFNNYLSLSKGEEPVSSPLLSTYRDYVALERGALASEQSRSYWTGKMDDAATTTVPRWSSASRSAGEQGVRVLRSQVVPEIYKGLKELAHQVGAPIKTVLLAIHLKVLSVISGRSEVITGVTCNGRPEQEDGDRVLGLFLNVAPFHIRLARGSWAELVRATFDAEQEMWPHRRFPLAEIKNIAGGRTLYDVAFNFTHFHVYKSIQENTGAQVLETATFAENNFTITTNFNLDVTSSEIQLVIEYDAAELCREQMEAVMGYYTRTLEAMASDPSAAHEAFSPLGEIEMRQLLIEWANTEIDSPTKTSCIHTQFEEQVEKTPNNIAIACEGEQLTYAELNHRANHLAHHLMAMGAGPEVLVGIYLERSIELIVVILGVIKAGGAYVPLDTDYPAHRLAFMLEDARLGLLITSSSLAERLPNSPVRLICIDRDWVAIAKQSLDNPNSLATPANAAYVIYTSGSTGRPKGVVVTHHNVARLFEATHSWFDFDERDVWTLFHSYAFDFSVWEIWGALLYGGRLVVVPYWVSRTPEAFYELVYSEGVTVLNQTPSAFYQLMEADKRRGEGRSLELRVIIFGGEKLEMQSLREWFDRHGDEKPRLVNMYGITETTVHVTYQRVRIEKLEDVGSSVIGRGIGDLQLYVLDEQRQPVPVGVAGELHVGGEGLARGYVNRAEVTAERFIPNPYSRRGGGRLYRTGDLVRYVGEGKMEYLGRIDEQVKVRGYRIELGEIEAVLSGHEMVRQAVVLKRDELNGDKRLVSYVVGEEGLTPGELKAYLRDRIPEYMVPARLVMIDRLPLTPNGKVDRESLSAIETGLPEYDNAYVAPRNLPELEIARIWEELLGVRPVGMKDNFFRLGGHSLLAVGLSGTIEQRLGKKIPLITIFKEPTVEQLAKVLRLDGRPEGWSPLVPIQPHGSKRPFFCAHPGGGDVFCYVELATRIGTDRPFYGFQARGLDSPQKPHTSIKEMAIEYIESLRSIQPYGPYLLGGWSIGGAIAFEMAQQLCSQGEQVLKLVLFDSLAPAPEHRVERLDDAALMRGFIRNLGLQAGISAPPVDEFDKLKPDEQLSYVLELTRVNNIIPTDEGLSYIQALHRVFKANFDAFQSYDPQPYDGPALLLKASEPIGEPLQDPTSGWGSLISGGLEVRSASGNHFTMLRMPQVENIGKYLGLYLN
jgi:amino acid adenylation domain-containing protein